MANRLGTNDPIYDLSRIAGGLNPLPGSPPDASLDATAVGYGSDTNTLTGDVSNFSYNDTTKLLSVKINEYWIQETKYVVVDADGRGDYTTLQAALNAIVAAAGNGAEYWTVIYRSPTTENVTFTAGATQTSLSVHVWALGGAQLTGWVKGDVYGRLHLHHLRIYNTDNFTAATLRSSNGGTIYAYDCELIREEALPTGPQGIVVDPQGGTVYLYRCKVQQVLGALYPAIRFVNGGEVYAWDCDIIANYVGAGLGGVTSNIAGGLYLYKCKISNVGAGSVIHIDAGDGTVSVWRCQYDTSNVDGTGTITILDGDVPPPDANSITPAMLQRPYTTTAVGITLDNTQEWIKVTAACTITLPAAASVPRWLYLITATANGVIVDANGSETINGSLTATLNSGDSLQFKCDGSNWFLT